MLSTSFAFSFFALFMTNCVNSPASFDLSLILDSEIPDEHIEIYAADPTNVTQTEENAIQQDQTLLDNIQSVLTNHIPNVTPDDYVVTTTSVYPGENMTNEVPVTVCILATKTGVLTGVKYFNAHVKANSTARFNIAACEGLISDQYVWADIPGGFPITRVPAEFIKTFVEGVPFLTDKVINTITQQSSKTSITSADFTLNVTPPEIGDYSSAVELPLTVSAVSKNVSGLIGQFTFNVFVTCNEGHLISISSYAPPITPTQTITSLTPNKVPPNDFKPFRDNYLRIVYEYMAAITGLTEDAIKNDQGLVISDNHVDNYNYQVPTNVTISVQAISGLSQYFIGNFYFSIKLLCVYETVSISNLTLNFQSTVVINSITPTSVTNTDVIEINNNEGLRQAIVDKVQTIAPSAQIYNLNITNNVSAGENLSSVKTCTITVSAINTQIISGSFTLNISVQAMDMRSSINDLNLGDQGSISAVLPVKFPSDPTYNGTETAESLSTKIASLSDLRKRVLSKLQTVATNITDSDFTITIPNTDQITGHNYTPDTSFNVDITVSAATAPESDIIKGSFTTTGVLALAYDFDSENRLIEMSCDMFPYNNSIIFDPFVDYWSDYDLEIY
jgi:hypothetical protein